MRERHQDAVIGEITQIAQLHLPEGMKMGWEWRDGHLHLTFHRKQEPKLHVYLHAKALDYSDQRRAFLVNLVKNSISMHDNFCSKAE